MFLSVLLCIIIVTIKPIKTEGEYIYMQDFIKPTLEYIEQNLKTDIKAEELAQIANYSARRKAVGGKFIRTGEKRHPDNKKI